MVQDVVIHNISAILIGAAQYKNEAYENEREWRLCMDTAINQTWYDEARQEFAKPKQCGDFELGKMSFSKKRGGTMSSYFDLCFKNRFPAIIKGIIMGPKSPNKDNIDLKKFLKIDGSDFQHWNIHRSKYRMHP
jgi:hypothetical protein